VEKLSTLFVVRHRVSQKLLPIRPVRRWPATPYGPNGNLKVRRAERLFDYGRVNPLIREVVRSAIEIPVEKANLRQSREKCEDAVAQWCGEIQSLTITWATRRV
jgi:hypothetical protein